MRKEQKWYKKSGEVTVFLSLICLIICGLIFAVIKSSRLSYQKSIIEITADISLKSAMSEYNKELFEKYGLLYVDTTYKGATIGGIQTFENHLGKYVDINLQNYDSDNEGLKFVMSIINNQEFANDNNYESVCTQIKKYMINTQHMSEFLSEEEYITDYMYSVFVDKLNLMGAEELNNDIEDLTCEEKKNYCVNVIQTKMRENTYDSFDFTNLLSEVSATVCVKTDSGKIYECTKEYSLN